MSIIGVVGGFAVVFAIASPLIPFISTLSNVSYIYSGEANATAVLYSSGFMGAFLSAVRSAMLVSLVVGLVSGVLQIYGWNSLRSYARERYSTPYLGGVLYTVGIVAESVSAYFLLGYLIPVINEISSGIQAKPSLQGAGIFALVILVSAFLLIVGEIMILIGIWRAGSDFNSVLLKVYIILIIIGAALYLVSYLIALIVGVISMISLIAGFYIAYRHSKALEASQPTGFGQ